MATQNRVFLALAALILLSGSIYTYPIFKSSSEWLGSVGTSLTEYKGTLALVVAGIGILGSVYYVWNWSKEKPKKIEEKRQDRGMMYTTVSYDGDSSTNSFGLVVMDQ